MRFKLNDKIIENILLKFGLEPENKIGYFLAICPSCGYKEAFIYKGSDKVICNRRNKCGNVSSIWDISKDILKDKEIIEIISKEYNNKDLQIKDLMEISTEIEIPDGVRFFNDQKKGMIRDRAFNYLKNRGLSEEVINELGYIYQPGNEFHNRIFIPFYESGELVYFMARDFTDKSERKYLNPHGISSKKYVFNIDKIKEGSTVFIFEGIMCAMSLKDQIGTAMLSADLGKEQAIKIIEKVPSKVVFVPDSDEAGMKTLYKNIKKFLLYKWPSLKIDIYIYYIKNVKDFNETGRNYIDIKKCEKFLKNDFNKIKWGKRKVL